MKVELKGIRELRGDETPMFNATLYIDGVKAALVSNGGTGGPCQYIWTDSKGYMPGALGKAFEAYAATLFPDQDFEQGDSLVYRLMDEAASAKKLKRLCAKKTLCHLPGQTYKEGEWSVFKCPFTPENKATLVQKYPGIEFANERL